MALVMAGRVLLGMEMWNAEAVYVGGIIVAIISFLLANGSMSDWLKWTRGIETPMRHGPPVGRPAWTRYFDVDYNHKVIGIQYGVTSLLLLIVGGTFALIFRTELAEPGLSFLKMDTYNVIFSLHGWVALASILVGIGGMSNYLVPLMIGAEDMAFPRLNAFAFWLIVPAAMTLLLSMLVGGWDSGLDGLSAPELEGCRGLPVHVPGHLCGRPFLDSGFAQPDCHDHPDAARRACRCSACRSSAGPCWPPA